MITLVEKVLTNPMIIRDDCNNFQPHKSFDLEKLNYHPLYEGSKISSGDWQYDCCRSKRVNKYHYERDNGEIRLTQFVRKRHSRVLTCDEE